MKKNAIEEPFSLANGKKNKTSTTSVSAPATALIGRSNACPSPVDIAAFIPYVIYNLDSSAEYTMKFTTLHESEYQPKKSRRATDGTAGQDVDVSVETSEESFNPFSSDVDQILITLKRNKRDQIVELTINRSRQVPRLLIKVLALCIPFHPELRRITVCRTPLSVMSLYELSKLSSVWKSKVTEMYLDDSAVPGHNYRMLLEHEPGLRVLSLARCSLDDDDFDSMAPLLAHPFPAAKFLNILNLSMNKMGDRSAFTFGKILRSNRSLQCINLAGNRITSEGALCIFSSLMEFPLTPEEVSAKRMRCVDFIKREKDVYEKTLADLKQNPLSETRPSKKSTNQRVKVSPSLASANYLQDRARALTAEQIGHFSDPFTTDKTMLRDNVSYSLGNMTLSWLNLSYNNLDYECIPILLQVLMYQSSFESKNETGLLRVRLAGNRLPVQCYEYDCIDDFIEKATAHHASCAINDRVGRTRDTAKLQQKKLKQVASLVL